MLRHRTFRRMFENRKNRFGSKNRRRLTESVLNGMTVTEFSDLSYRDQYDLVTQFCKDKNIHFTVILDSDDSVTDDGSFDDDVYSEYESQMIDEAEAVIAEELLKVLVDDGKYDAWETAFWVVDALNLAEDATDYIKVYDLHGFNWPKPPSNYPQYSTVIDERRG